jgi:hypothetical protein
MPWPQEIQEAEDRMNGAKVELLAYVESKEPRDRDRHHGLVAKLLGAIREFEERVADQLKVKK